MVENDAAVAAATSTPRRKTLIATRLRLHQQNAAMQGRGDVESSSGDALNVSGSEGSNEIQLVHDRDAFKVGIERMGGFIFVVKRPGKLASS